jgi:hypothetical protein
MYCFAFTVSDKETQNRGAESVLQVKEAALVQLLVPDLPLPMEEEGHKQTLKKKRTEDGAVGVMKRSADCKKPAKDWTTQQQAQGKSIISSGSFVR